MGSLGGGGAHHVIMIALYFWAGAGIIDIFLLGLVCTAVVERVLLCSCCSSFTFCSVQTKCPRYGYLNFLGIAQQHKLLFLRAVGL